MADHDTHDHSGVPGAGAPSEITAIPTAEMDDTLVLAPDGAGGVEFRSAGPLHNYAASATPAVTDDTGDGYSVGSIWIDTTADEAFICSDASSGAAVWLPFDNGGGGAGDPYSDHIAAHSDVVQYWRLNEASGVTTFVDTMGGTSLTVTGNVSAGGPPLVKDAAGGSVSMNGSASGKLTRSAITRARPFTLECWTITGSGSGGVCGQWNGSAGPMFFTNGVGDYRGYASGTPRILVTTQANHWGRHHLVLTVSAGGTATFYFDGAQVGATLGSGTDFASSTTFELGAYASGGGSGATGFTISDVAYYDTEMTSGEVSTHYTLGLTGV